jgi:hypothetical protein
MSEGRLASENFSPVEDETVSASEAELTQEDIRALLYTTEQLRKQEYVGEEDEETTQEAAASVAAEAAAAVE